MNKLFLNMAVIGLLLGSLSAPSYAMDKSSQSTAPISAQGVKPSGPAMVVDAVVARPLLFVGTVLGTGIYILSWPFSKAGGNSHDAYEALVATPARATFERCLGCDDSNTEYAPY